MNLKPKDTDKGFVLVRLIVINKTNITFFFISLRYMAPIRGHSPPMHMAHTMDNRYPPNGGPLPVPMTEQSMSPFNSDMAPPGTEPPPPGFENEAMLERLRSESEWNAPQRLPTKHSVPSIPRRDHK